jgi:predicted TIM-barrel fold metal-dependent hydrolase
MCSLIQTVPPRSASRRQAGFDVQILSHTYPAVEMVEPSLAVQTAGEMDSGWSLSNNAYDAIVNVIGIERIVFTIDCPHGKMKSTRQVLEQMAIDKPDKEKIAHLNAERLFTNYKAGMLLTSGR